MWYRARDEATCQTGIESCLYWQRRSVSTATLPSVKGTITPSISMAWFASRDYLTRCCQGTIWHPILATTHWNSTHLYLVKNGNPLQNGLLWLSHWYSRNWFSSSKLKKVRYFPMLHMNPLCNMCTFKVALVVRSVMVGVNASYQNGL